jgi:hypothetical protein
MMGIAGENQWIVRCYEKAKWMTSLPKAVIENRI